MVAAACAGSNPRANDCSRWHQQATHEQFNAAARRQLLAFQATHEQ